VDGEVLEVSGISALAVEDYHMSTSSKEFELVLEVILGNKEMSNKEVSARLAGDVSLGGQLPVHRRVLSAGLRDLS